MSPLPLEEFLRTRIKTSLIKEKDLALVDNIPSLENWKENSETSIISGCTSISLSANRYVPTALTTKKYSIGMQQRDTQMPLKERFTSIPG